MINLTRALIGWFMVMWKWLLRNCCLLSQYKPELTWTSCLITVIWHGLLHIMRNVQSRSDINSEKPEFPLDHGVSWVQIPSGTLIYTLCRYFGWRLGSLVKAKRNTGTSPLITQYKQHMPTGFANFTYYIQLHQSQRFSLLKNSFRNHQARAMRITLRRSSCFNIISVNYQ